jgi:hypothetical protein
MMSSTITTLFGIVAAVVLAIAGWMGWDWARPKLERLVSWFKEKFGGK